MPDASPEIRQGIFHPGRNDRIDLPAEQSVRFQLPQLLGEHLGGGAGNLQAQLGKAECMLNDPKMSALYLPPMSRSVAATGQCWPSGRRSAGEAPATGDVHVFMAVSSRVLAYILGAFLHQPVTALH